MRKFNNLEKMKKYQNANTGAYEFVENGKLLDIEITFDLVIDGDIKAGDIIAMNITAGNINAGNILAENITACDIKAYIITAEDITAINIVANYLGACDIKATNIEARDINAENIVFYAVCFAYKNLVCESIEGQHQKSRFFSLDGKVFIDGIEVTDCELYINGKWKEWSTKREYFDNAI